MMGVLKMMVRQLLLSKTNFEVLNEHSVKRANLCKFAKLGFLTAIISGENAPLFSRNSSEISA